MRKILFESLLRTALTEPASRCPTMRNLLSSPVRSIVRAKKVVHRLYPRGRAGSCNGCELEIQR